MKNYIIKVLSLIIVRLLKNKKILFIIPGFFSLLWFLIRVIPKTSRAAYPCQRAAFPLASGFVIWMLGFTASYISIRKAGKYFKASKYKLAILSVILTIFLVFFFLFEGISEDTFASVRGVNNAIQVDVRSKFNISLLDEVVAPISKVSIVQSTKSKVSEIDYSEIKSMVSEAVNLAGGLGNIIHNGNTVLLKPNIVVSFLESPTARDLYPEANGVTTDWRIVKAVVELVREINPDGKVYVAEGSADASTKANFTKLKYTNQYIAGVDSFIAFEESGDWEEWDSPDLVKVTLPSGKALYSISLKPNKSNEFYLNKVYFEADVVISLPLLKNHKDAGITGAVKNVGIGATPQNIYGGAKGNNARWLNQRINHDWANLHKWIHDFYLCRQVNFAIMDGLQGLMDGPCGGWKSLEATQQNMRLILASKDPIAIDAISALIMGFDPNKVPYLNYLSKDSVGCINPAYIAVKGKKVHEVRKKLGFTDSSVGGNVSISNDFTPPVITIDDYKISPEAINIDLNADNQVVKVEIAIDNTIADSLFVINFDNIYVKTGKTITDPKEVKIYAYDQFLNCSALYLDGTPAEISPLKCENIMRVFPNPFKENIKVKFNKDIQEEATVNIYDMSGRIILRTLAGKSKSLDFNLSDLRKGTYFLVLADFNTIESVKIIKQ